MSSKPERAPNSESQGAAFAPGSIVLVSLNSPREKFWGMVLELQPAGVSLRGIELNCFEDFSRQVKAGDPVTPNAVFFPMHRVERMELDTRDGDIPSMQERFEGKSGSTFRKMFGAG